MGIDCYELKEHVIKPALSALGISTESMVYLLLGTASQETSMGTFILQKKIGFQGGIGIYQCESESYHRIWDMMIKPFASMRAKVKLFLGYESKPMLYRLAGDLHLATVISALYYHDVKEKLPKFDDVEGLAKYYKTYYNTSKGKATEEQFIRNYKKYVIC